MKLSVLSASLVLVSALSVSAAAPAAKPNVLFISVDDMNDAVSVLGGWNGVKTPNFDRLAAMGQVFTNAHCAAPICNPSRTAIMLGRNPSTTGIYENNQWWRPAWPDVVTLPAYFKANGYWTEGAGKNFHHTQGFNDPPAWSHYYHWAPDAETQGWTGGYQVAPDPEPAKRGWPELEPKGGVEFDGAPLDLADEAMPDGKVVAHAAKFLGAAHAQPFFLSVGIFRPHTPHYVPRKYFELYPKEKLELPPWKADDRDDIPEAAKKLTLHPKTDKHELIVKHDRWRDVIQSYLAAISFADAQLGVLLDALEKSPHAKNTVVVLWSDHGFHLGEKNHWQKWTLWRKGTRVPLLIAAPGVTAPGSRSAQAVSLVDLYPTLVELCGLPAQAGLDGRSLAPVLRDASATWEKPALTTLEKGNHSLNGARWHYIRYADGSEELYDFIADPNEWTNLAARAEFSDVKRDLARWLPAVDAPAAPAKGAYKFDPVEFTWTPKPKK